MLRLKLANLAILSTIFNIALAAQQFYPFRNPVAGKILYSDMSPVAGCEVTIVPLNGAPATIQTAQTGAGGEFEFQNLDPGMYQVIARAGRDEVRETVALDGVNLPELKLRLPAASPNTTMAGSTVSVSQLRIPDRARHAYEKAEQAFSRQEFDSVSEYLVKALTSHACFADALTLRALLQMQAGDLHGATADLQGAMRCDGAYAKAYLVLGSLYNRLHQFNDALRVLTRGVQLAPSAWQGYFETAKALMAKLDFDGALRQLAKAQALTAGKFPELHFARAEALIGAKLPAEAVSELRAYLREAPTGDRAEEARRLLERVLQGMAASRVMVAKSCQPG